MPTDALSRPLLLATLLGVAAVATLSAACTVTAWRLRRQAIHIGPAGWALFGLALVSLLIASVAWHRARGSSLRDAAAAVAATAGGSRP